MHLFNLTPDELAAQCVALDLPRYTAGQVLRWVWQRGVVDFPSMTDLSRAARERLGEALTVYDGAVRAEQVASDGTRKLLVAWPDAPRGGALPVLGAASERETECVMIPTERRRTACISSQVGCPVGCRFCASGLGGLEGNLSTGRIVEQVHRLRHLEGAGRVSHVVFMGMGEPLANASNVLRAIRFLNAPWAAGIGARRITVSTVGLPAGIRRLVDFDVPVTLALSLHAPNDALRRSLIPWAEYTSIDDLLDACDEYFRRTGREITLEYILIRNVNDRPEHARELVRVARRLRANVNLIRYNEVRDLPYERPATEDVRRFQEILRAGRVNTHIRASRGRDIAAACGQLRHERASA